MLKLSNVTAGYGRGLVLHGISLDVPQGSICALIGANGAGKTTTLRCIVGLLRPSAGNIEFGGESILGTRPEQLVQKGISLVPEGRRIFEGLTVLEHLNVGGFKCTDGRELSSRRDWAFSLFPRLQEKRHHMGTTLSGGEQQMLAIARSLMSKPSLLLLDEPSMGLAPLIVNQVFAILETLRETGTTILIVEQNARRTLKLADFAYVIENGSLALQGAGRELLADERVASTYLGR
jgi:branched-chain amino acid transport system ATP-binding protein